MERAAGTATGRRDMFAVDEDAALAELELTREDGGYHGFSARDGICPAIRSAGQMLTGAAQDELDRKVRADWQAMQ